MSFVAERDPAAAPSGADAVPDSRGINLYRADPELEALLSLYLPADLARHLQPHLDRLGGLAGGALDEMAGAADRNPPTLVARTRRGEDRQRLDKHPAYVAMEQLAFGQPDLATLLGSRSRASEIMTGRRGLTLEQIRLIAKSWRVPVAVLVGADQTRAA